jgi:hypothetical protein
VHLERHPQRRVPGRKLPPARGGRLLAPRSDHGRLPEVYDDDPRLGQHAEQQEDLHLRLRLQEGHVHVCEMPAATMVKFLLEGKANVVVYDP